MLQGLMRLIQNAADLVCPHARAGTVVDPIEGITLPAREGLGLIMTTDYAPNLGSLANGPGLVASFPLLSCPPMVRMEYVDGDIRQGQIISEATRARIIADMKRQVAESEDHRVQSIPRLSPESFEK